MTNSALFGFTLCIVLVIFFSTIAIASTGDAIAKEFKRFNDRQEGKPCKDRD